MLDYARRFDKAELTEATIRVTPEEIAEGAAACDPAVREAIAFAARRIRAYHERQRPADARFVDEAGVEAGLALDGAGCRGRGFIAVARRPGAAYPSTGADERRRRSLRRRRRAHRHGHASPGKMQ